MRTIRHSFAAALVTALLVAPAAHAQVPGTLVHQGRLLDASGVGLNGIKPLVFKIYDQETGGDPLYTETRNAKLSNGFYTETLGQGGDAPIDPALLTSGTLWLELTVNGQALTPRHRIESVPYAILANTAVNVDGGYVDATSISINGTPIVDEAGQWVGSGGPGGGTLDALACSVGQVPKWVGGETGWACGDDVDTDTDTDTDTLAALAEECTLGQHPAFNAMTGQWVCWDWENPLEQIGCELGEVLMSHPDGWGCGAIAPATDTLATLPCGPQQVAKWETTGWECAADADTLGLLGCPPGHFPVRGESDWTCVEYDATELLEDLASSCPDGSVLRWQTDPGFWTCSPDQDSFAWMACQDGDLMRFQDGGWQCSIQDADTLAVTFCPEGWVLKSQPQDAIKPWDCAPDEDQDTLGKLKCGPTERAGWDEVEGLFTCVEDRDTLAKTPCSDGNILRFDNGQKKWVCSNDIDTNTDLLATLGCGEGRIPKRYDGVWECHLDEVRTDAEIRQAVSAQPIALQAGSTVGGVVLGAGVPVGTRIVWWDTFGNQAFPPGYLPAGALVEDPNSPLYNRTLPEAGEAPPSEHYVLYKVLD